MEISSPVLDKRNVHVPDFNLLYLLTSKDGFGHTSRAMAITRELGSLDPIVFAAHQNAHPFIQDNLAGLDGKLDLCPLNYDRNPMEYSRFVATNTPLLDRAGHSQLIMTDFLVHLPHVIASLKAEGKRPRLGGVFHSFVGYNLVSAETRAYRERKKKIADCLDFVFLAEPKLDHRAPYELDSGTLMIPCEPIVRQPEKSPREVKQELGLESDDEFIYIQGGMRGSKELSDFVKSLGEVCLQDIKWVVASSDHPRGAGQIVEGDIISIPPRMDGQNLVHASAGVISKPGMQILSEAVANRKPLLFTDDPKAERKIKFIMLEEILGYDLPFRLDSARNATSQIKHWLEASPDIAQRFSKISCNGAKQVASALTDQI